MKKQNIIKKDWFYSKKRKPNSNFLFGRKTIFVVSISAMILFSIFAPITLGATTVSGSITKIGGGTDAMVGGGLTAAECGGGGLSEVANIKTVIPESEDVTPEHKLNPDENKAPDEPSNPDLNPELDPDLESNPDQYYPVADFDYTIDGLNVSFIDGSYMKCHVIHEYESAVPEISTASSIQPREVVKKETRIDNKADLNKITSKSDLEVVKKDFELIDGTRARESPRIVSWEWDFDGDGTKDSEYQNPTHMYLLAGECTVTLTVTDNNGLNDTKTKQIIVDRKDPPIANNDTSIVYKNSGQNLIDVRSNDISVNDDLTIESFDSNEHRTIGTVEIIDGYLYYTPEFDYIGPDSFTYTVEDDNGNDSAAVEVTVTEEEEKDNIPPVADIIYYGPEPVVLDGDEVFFDGSGSYDPNPDGTIVSYKWNFGDGTTETGEKASHTYSEIGTYTVTLIVTDDKGAKGTATVKVPVVAPNKPPTADAGGPYFGYENEQMIFNATNSSDSDGTIVSYEWDFGDGSNGTGAIVNHTYEENGTYFVKLTVTDDDDATDTDTVYIVIKRQNGPPSKPEVKIIDDKYTFTVLSVDPDDDKIQYTFDWDDGTNTTTPFLPNGTAITTEHKWIEPGEYVLEVYAEDEFNHKSEVTNLTISIPDSSDSGGFSGSAGGKTGFLNMDKTEILYAVIGLILLGIAAAVIFRYKKKKLMQ